MQPQEPSIAKTLDAVVKTGKPKMLQWKGATLQVTPYDKLPVSKSKKPLSISQQKKKAWLQSDDPGIKIMLCDPEELVHMDWSIYWNPDPH